MAQSVSSSRKNDALLAAENGTSSQTSWRGKSSASSTVGWFGHLLIASLPLWVCGLMLAILGCLILSFQDGESIRNKTVSIALVEYQPYSEIALMALLVATLTFAVTASRNIQIAVSMQRSRKDISCSSSINNRSGSNYSCFSRFLNNVMAVINILAYIGFVVLIAFRDNQEEPPYANLLHTIGSFVYFAGVAIYAIIHSYLLYRQGQVSPNVYPRYLQWLFVGLAVAIIICVIVYAFNYQAGEAIEFEWFAVFLTAIYTGLFSSLFHIDNVDDELRDFFGSFFCCCCRCC